MKQVLVLVGVLLSGVLLKADQSTNETMSKLPQGIYKGVLADSGNECDVEVFKFYSNRDDVIAVQITEGREKDGAKFPIMALNSSHILTKTVVVNDSKKVLRSTYAYAECCHSGGRDEAYVELIDNKITSVRIEEYEDVTKTGSFKDLQEEKTFDKTCVLTKPVSLY